jgi:putative transcription factor
MTACEMCGTETKTVFALIEGVELKVCSNCASFGKIIKKPVIKKKPSPQNFKRAEREIIQVIREDFSRLIRNKREKLGLKQKEFAKFLAEKESIIHQIESGNYTPSLELARKIERQLGINLVESKQIEPQNLKAKKETYTIGDILKIK